VDGEEVQMFKPDASAGAFPECPTVGRKANGGVVIGSTLHSNVTELTSDEFDMLRRSFQEGDFAEL